MPVPGALRECPSREPQLGSSLDRGRLLQRPVIWLDDALAGRGEEGRGEGTAIETVVWDDGGGVVKLLVLLALLLMLLMWCEDEAWCGLSEVNRGGRECEWEREMGRGSLLALWGEREGERDGAGEMKGAGDGEGVRWRATGEVEG
jgi:hypothetical protein